MIRIGWFTPVSAKTGIATYSAQVLGAIRDQFAPTEIEVIVFHPPTDDAIIDMPYPMIALSDSLLASDFFALFDVAVYHLGNNSQHHAPIYAALMRHPGVVVLHDHVYQHYLAGVSLGADYFGASFVTLLQNADPTGFQMMQSSGVMRCFGGGVSFVPWESEWATKVPLGDRFASLGLGTVVHSDYARQGLCGPGAVAVETLFMPRPDVPDVSLPVVRGRRIRIACCGHIGVTKGLTQLIDAFIGAADLQRAFHVTIAGFANPLSYVRALEKTIAEAGLGGVFEIRADPSDAEYGNVMASCDIFYNLRYPNTEGASLSLMEQLAQGRPVIAYRTGAFAEIPDAACYYIDGIGDDQALKDVLSAIAADPAGITARGEAALAAVQDKTAAEYARRFVAHLQRQSATFKRRAALVHARAEGQLPDPGQDRDWLSAYMHAHGEMQHFYKGRLLVPDNFARMSRRLKGAFLANAILNAAVTPEAAEAIGADVEGLSAVALHDVVGKLRTIGLVSDGHDRVAANLFSAARPITDLRIWPILARLPAPVAANYALLALGHAEDGATTLSQAIEKVGFRIALRNLVCRNGSLDASAIGGTPLADFLNSPSDEILALPVAPLGETLLDCARAARSGALLLDEGFHGLEEIGMWGAALQSTIYINNPATRRLTRVTGVVALLAAAVKQRETVTVTVEEMATGRRENHQVVYLAGDPAAMAWDLRLDGFHGPLKAIFTIGNLYCPAECHLSEDARHLGVLVQSLVLHDATTPDDAVIPADPADPRIPADPADPRIPAYPVDPRDPRDRALVVTRGV